MGPHTEEDHRRTEKDHRCTEEDRHYKIVALKDLRPRISGIFLILSV